MDNQTPITPATSVNPVAPAADPVAAPTVPPTIDPNVADATVAATLTTAAQTTDPLLATSRRGRELQPQSIPETPASATTLEGTPSTTPEASPVAGPTDVEPAKELEPEVEKAIERITTQQVNAPQQVVIAAEHMPQELPKTVAQPVVVLPLAEAKMNQGSRKNSSNSIRWLYEWCVRQIKKIKDVVVVYRE